MAILRVTTGTPVTGASNARVYEKIAIFDQYLTVSQTRTHDTRYRQLLWNANRKPYLSFRMVPFSMILSDFYSRSVQSVRQSKSFRFVLEANEKTNFCSELLAVFENWLSGCFACVRWIGS